MNRTHTHETPRDIDLHTTRRTFQLAREQVAANSRTDHFLAAQAMRHWSPVAHEIHTGETLSGRHRPGAAPRHGERR